MLKVKNSFKKIKAVNPLYILSFAVVIWFIISFLIIPNVNILTTTFFTDKGFSFDAIEKILNSKRAMSSLKNSFILAFSIAITSNIVGIFLVLCTDYFAIKGAKILRLGYSTTLVFGGIVLANGYLFLYGKSGFLTNVLTNIFPDFNESWFVGYPAVLFMMTFACTSLHMIFLRGAISNLDYQTIEAAKNMGASQFYIIRKIIVPSLLPVLFTLTILLFQTGLGALSAPLMVGGKDFQTISPMILTFAQRPSSRDLAALLSIILGAIQLILLLIIMRVERKTNYITGSKVKTKLKKQKINNPIGNAIMHILAWGLFAIYTIPVILILIFSFTDTYSISTGTLSLSSFTLDHYIAILTDSKAYRPFLTSVIYAGLASFIVVVSMLFIARVIQKYRNKLTATLELSLYIPWILPGLLFALGLILTYDKPNWYMFNYVLTGTTIIMLIAYIIVNIPFTMRVIKSAYFAFDESLEDAAKNLGAGGLYTYIRVILPIVLPAALAVFALNFNGHLSDYDLSVFLYHPLYQPLGVVIFNAADETASIDAKAISMVYSVILMGINALVLYLVYGRGNKINTGL
ncbi:iron ABC transporter permease [Bacillus sp. FJAT-50079]|uniref:ABC transporter permease n=1 Tax=Bacillus sp. FJAT-50079 TaxID=2833577 RepID=UPI001BC9C087|nr:iron ABC transporter permease [Bacillus sp. FJAT-50079]